MGSNMNNWKCCKDSPPARDMDVRVRPKDQIKRSKGTAMFYHSYFEVFVVFVNSVGTVIPDKELDSYEYMESK
jgi:hypothetical protein